jgi:Zn finger protein HypA/HybF involved in hydrogenase expression
MSTNVVRMDEYRKARQPARPRGRMANPSDAEHYFCMRCDSDQFRLYSGGEVHCAKCGSLMQNLSIGELAK